MGVFNQINDQIVNLLLPTPSFLAGVIFAEGTSVLREEALALQVRFASLGKKDKLLLALSAQ